MTRRTLFRHILAIKMLPNTTAWWCLMPRKAKRWLPRNAHDALARRIARIHLDFWTHCYEKHMDARYKFETVAFDPISEKIYRIPILFRNGASIALPDSPTPEADRYRGTHET